MAVEKIIASFILEEDDVSCKESESAGEVLYAVTRHFKVEEDDEKTFESFTSPKKDNAMQMFFSWVMISVQAHIEPPVGFLGVPGENIFDDPFMDDPLL